MNANAVHVGGTTPGRRSGSGIESLAVYLVQSRETRSSSAGHREPARGGHGRAAGDTARTVAGADAEVTRLSTRLSKASQAHADLIATYHLTVQAAQDAVERYRISVVTAQERIRLAIETGPESTNGPKAV